MSLKSHVQNCLVALLLATTTAFAQTGTGSGASNNDPGLICHGRWPNPINDICWSCFFPFSLGPFTLIPFGQEDIENNVSPICYCGTYIGVTLGFWEPSRVVDVTRTAWCFPALGGLQMTNSTKTTATSVVSNQAEPSTPKTSFYHSHYFVNPILPILHAVTEAKCLKDEGFDVAYITEIDPTWADDELTMLFNPEIVLFANPFGVAACAADCAAATVGFPFKNMSWCNGCQGVMYPLNGHVANHISGVQASSLILARMMVKLHREFIAYSGHGPAGACAKYPEYWVDKRAYKYNMMYPRVQSAKINGRCCQPLGRSTLLWGAAKEYPVKGESYVYLLFQKRNCCERVYGY